MIYVLVVGLVCSSLNCNEKILDYAKNIGVTRVQTKKECLYRLKKMKKFLIKNNFPPAAYCKAYEK